MQKHCGYRIEKSLLSTYQIVDAYKVHLLVCL